ncbi:MAG: hypothetical protein C0501_31865 [Isosphaera sp.]|nr:hypothetical protein [Isosphaera sp.]
MPRLFAAGLVAAVLAVPGCGSDDLDSPTAARLRAVGNMYLDYAVAKKGQGPDAEGPFKAHIRGKPDQVLAPAGIDRKEVDGLFASDRDGEPFVVLYGRKIAGVSGTDAPVVAHEKTGKGGRRLVVFANGKVELADESRLKELLAKD